MPLVIGATVNNFRVSFPTAISPEAETSDEVSFLRMSKSCDPEGARVYDHKDGASRVAFAKEGILEASGFSLSAEQRYKTAKNVTANAVSIY